MSAKRSAKDKSPGSKANGTSFSLVRIILVTALLALGAAFGASKYSDKVPFKLMPKHGNPAYWVHKLQPVNLSEAQLASYDGKDGKPIYLAVNGTVYDVSASPELYGPGGSYSFFTGKDGARAYITGCFATDLTHDLRGVPEEEWIELVAWKLFYDTHAKYFKVGTVFHPPIDPRIPPPAPCNAQKRSG